MKHAAKSMPRGARIDPSELRALGNPLDFIADDHMRQREICVMTEHLAQGEVPDIAQMEELLAFLDHELCSHIEDEDRDLFGLMQRRCPAEDDIDAILPRLRANHDAALKSAARVRRLIARQLANPVGFSDADRKVLATFADHARRHVIVENAVVLPLARARLGARDLDALRLKMLRRRGLDRLLEE
jgi:hemerythrin-like domain-containing protein